MVVFLLVISLSLIIWAFFRAPQYPVSKTSRGFCRDLAFLSTWVQFPFIYFWIQDGNWVWEIFFFMSSTASFVSLIFLSRGNWEDDDEDNNPEDEPPPWDWDKFDKDFNKYKQNKNKPLVNA